jgi:hypothetical protein
MKALKFGLIFFTLAMVSCEQESATLGEDAKQPVCGIRVKVVYSFCTYIFLEIQDEGYYHLGDANWRFVDGRTTRPVFMVTNICDFGAELYQNNLLDVEFEVKQVATYEDDCASCMGGYGGALPSKSLIVRLCNGVEE